MNWIIHYECPVCGEHSRTPDEKCPFCDTALDVTPAALRPVVLCKVIGPNPKGFTLYECPVCGESRWRGDMTRPNFCANCGRGFQYEK